MIKKYWENLYSILSKYRKEYNPKKEEINKRYEKLIQNIKIQEEKELKLLSKNINKKVNPENVDIFISGQTLHYKLGKEIGSVIKVKLKKHLKEKPNKLEEYLKIKDEFIFVYTKVDREGIFMFVSDEWEGWLEASCIIAYFDVDVINK
jgi:hypothetical protein